MGARMVGVSAASCSLRGSPGIDAHALRAARDGVSPRIAAHELGIERVVEAARTRGYV